MTESDHINPVEFETLNVLRFPLIALVIYIHSYNPTTLGNTVVDAMSPEWIDAIKYLISRVVGFVAVPIFFLASGFLFFRERTFSYKLYAKKVRARVHSLVIPFFFWTTAVAAALCLAQLIPAFDSVLNAGNPRLVDLPPINLLDKVYGLSTLRPIAYQFWFIRDLILVVLMSPLIYLVIRYIDWLSLPILFGLWLFGLWPVLAPGIEPVLFFSFGGWMAIRFGDLTILRRAVLYSAWAYPVLAIIAVLLREHEVGEIILRSSILAGVPLAIGIASAVVYGSRLRNLLGSLALSSFFLFAIHEPVLTILKKVIYNIDYTSSAVDLFSYFVIPLIIAAISVPLYFTLRRVMPNFINLVTGGR